MKIYPFTNLFWVNKDLNLQPKKFSWPTGQYISCNYWKQIYWLKYILKPNQHLFFEFSNNSGINSKICSIITKEATDVILLSLSLTLNTFDLFLVFFSWVWKCKCRMEYFVPLKVHSQVKDNFWLLKAL